MGQICPRTTGFNVFWKAFFFSSRSSLFQTPTPVCANGVETGVPLPSVSGQGLSRDPNAFAFQTPRGSRKLTWARSPCAPQSGEALTSKGSGGALIGCATGRGKVVARIWGTRSAGRDWGSGVPRAERPPLYSSSRPAHWTGARQGGAGLWDPGTQGGARLGSGSGKEGESGGGSGDPRRRRRRP